MHMYLLRHGRCMHTTRTRVACILLLARMHNTLARHEEKGAQARASPEKACKSAVLCRSNIERMTQPQVGDRLIVCIVLNSARRPTAAFPVSA